MCVLRDSDCLWERCESPCYAWSVVFRTIQTLTTAVLHARRIMDTDRCTTALVAKAADAILTSVLDTHESVKDCPLCQKPFGSMDEASGSKRRVMSVCAFQKGARVREDRRRSCVACSVCVLSDEDGTGHVSSASKSGKCRVCIEVKGTGVKDACFATLPATEIPEMTTMFQALDRGSSDNATRLLAEDSQLQDEASKSQRLSAETAQDAAAQRRGFADRASELEHREAVMNEARDKAERPFSGSSWDDYLEYDKQVQPSFASVEKKLEEAKRAEENAKRLLEEEKRTVDAKLREQKEAVERKAEEAKRSAVEDVARIAAEKQNEAVLAAVAKVKTAYEGGKRKLGDEEGPLDANAGAEQKKVPRTEESKKKAAEKREAGNETLKSCHVELLEMAELLAFKAPEGMVKVAKGNDVGEYRLDGKLTKDGLVDHLPSFLRRMNRRTSDLIEENEALRKAVVDVLTMHYKGVLETEDNVQAAVAAKLIDLGLHEGATDGEACEERK